MPAPKAFCEKRNDMANSLVDLSIRLSIAAAEMADVAGVSRDPAFLKAKLETERLRDECDRVKNELTHHRLKHGC